MSLGRGTCASVCDIERQNDCEMPLRLHPAEFKRILLTNRNPTSQLQTRDTVADPDDPGQILITKHRSCPRRATDGELRVTVEDRGGKSYRNMKIDVD